MKPKAILFDMDGTLVDTLRDIADAANAVLARRGLPTWPLQDYRYFVGDGARNLCQRIMPHDASDADVDAFLQAYVRQYDAHCLDHTTLYPGVRALLDGLALRRTPRAILSNKPHDFATRMAAQLFRDDDFAFVWGERPEVPRKPDPAGALAAAAALGFAPDEMCFVGDTSIDMRTGCAAGMVAVGVAWGFRPVEELLAHGASVVLSHPEALLGLLET